MHLFKCDSTIRSFLPSLIQINVGSRKTTQYSISVVGKTTEVEEGELLIC